jgi:hypothetical protein
VCSGQGTAYLSINTDKTSFCSNFFVHLTILHFSTLPLCPVCSGQGTAYLTINTDKTSLDLLLRRVLKQELGLNEPILDTGENMIECLSSFGDAEALNSKP